MRYSKSDLTVVCTVQSEPNAHIIKTHLESEGIPAHLRWESYGKLCAFTAVGLGHVSILVRQELAEDAKRVIKPQDIVHHKSECSGINLIGSAILIGLLVIIVLGGTA